MVAVFFLVPAAHGQYNPSAGRSAPEESVQHRVRRADGRVEVRREVRRPARDSYGNAAGHQFDLARDGAFEGQTVAVLHFYTGAGFDFALPTAALREKGFSVYRWSNAAPSVAELRRGLARANQLWLISGATRLLTDAHLDVIEDFFEAGHGVYIWGDNDPYFADANALATRLLDTSMSGNLQGDQVVELRTPGRRAGLRPDHLITTGLEWLFEGHTVATLTPSSNLEPLLHGSAGNLVAAFHDRGGRRAILDGGFTRLYHQWDTAGTARYVKNAAAWLANVERFGAEVLPDQAAPR